MIATSSGSSAVMPKIWLRVGLGLGLGLGLELGLAAVAR